MWALIDVLKDGTTELLLRSQTDDENSKLQHLAPGDGMILEFERIDEITFVVRRRYPDPKTETEKETKASYANLSKAKLLTLAAEKGIETHTKMPHHELVKLLLESEKKG